MSRALLIAADLIAVLLLVFGLYFPRNRRRDMVVALLSVNVAVLAIATTFTNVEVNLGLGLGLFGVLSIIRLRSSELGQQEIAYYFSSLAIGLLGGVEIEPEWVSPALMAAVLFALWLGDHQVLLRGYRHQNLILDRAYTDEAELVEVVEALLGGADAVSVRRVTLRRVDLVNDSTNIDVHYRLKA
ncbi:MAG: DUF4956 domain-containing protein [Acidimicrobiaceae bacterium]|nr:DUF4956 domain-containing protein [Acidimicrobiaceae bacterium]